MSQVRVRCRRFRIDGERTVWHDDRAGTVMRGTESTSLYDSVCDFIGRIGGRFVAVTDGTSLYGMHFVTVYYREEVPVAPV